MLKTINLYLLVGYHSTVDVYELLVPKYEVFIDGGNEVQEIVEVSSILRKWNIQ